MMNETQIQELRLACRTAMLGDDAGAKIRAGDALLAVDPANVQGLVCAASGFQGLETFGIAAMLLGAASKQRPELGEIWNNLGCALQEYHPADALSCFEKAMRAAPDLPDPVRNTVATLSALGRWRDAIAVGESFLAENPGDGETHHNLGLACLQVGRWADAWDHWRVSTG